MKTPVLLSTEDAARILRVSASTVRTWADDGLLPVAYKTDAKRRLFREADVNALRERRRPSRAAPG